MTQLDLFSNESNEEEATPESESLDSNPPVERRRASAHVSAPLVRASAAAKAANPQLGAKSAHATLKQDLWDRYFANPCEETRNDLSLVYRPLVKMIAESMKDKFPGHVDVDDLISQGYIGLLDAISKFNPNLNIKFESYSVMRIRGEILDSIRSQDIFPRQVRIQQNNYRKALKELSRTLHREPHEEEIAAHMQLTAKQFETLMQSFSSGRLISIDAGSEDKDGNSAPHVDKMSNANDKGPSYNMQREEVMELILRGLSKKEKSVMLGYYIEGQTMKQIGELLGLSESRVCQIHMEVLISKKKKLGRYEDLWCD